MARCQKAKGKIVRRLGINIYGNPKYDKLLEVKPHGPGEHGSARSKASEYKHQLVEKQKLRLSYGMSEKQFRNVFKKAKAKSGVTGDVMLEMLERRLDNVIYRAGFASTRSQARQMVGHGHFKLNGGRASVPSMLVSLDDVITVKDKQGSKDLVTTSIETSKHEDVLWLETNKEELSVKVVRYPTPEEAAPPAEIQLIIEFYSK
ncbi:MAG: 30S ribosomal protein S4 [Kiritimatiellae bacterium]|jgi:small subunit ribosomal protein S4|nr:30S ribosomal protein S4 [Kiritimatiellia bacterium]